MSAPGGLLSSLARRPPQGGRTGNRAQDAPKSRKLQGRSRLPPLRLLPGTVAYAGYGSLIERRDWDGAAWTTGVGPYRTSERGFFFKASYNYSF